MLKFLTILMTPKRLTLLLQSSFSLVQQWHFAMLGRKVNAPTPNLKFLSTLDHCLLWTQEPIFNTSMPFSRARIFKLEPGISIFRNLLSKLFIKNIGETTLLKGKKESDCENEEEEEKIALDAKLLGNEVLEFERLESS